MVNIIHSRVCRSKLYAIFVGILCLFSTLSFHVSAEDAKSALDVGLVSKEQLNNKINEVSSSTYLTQQEKNTLIELYRKSLSEISLSEDYQEKHAFYNDAIKTYPKKTAEILLNVKSRKKNLEKTSSKKIFKTSLIQAEQKLNKLKADLAATRAKLTEFQNQLSYELSRPEKARDELLNARKSKDTLSGNFHLAPDENKQDTNILEAEKWLRESKSQRVKNEILAIDEELLSHDVRQKHLTANIELTQLNVNYVQNQINQLEHFLSNQRLTEIQQAIDENNDAIQLLTDDTLPIIQEAINKNQSLIDELALSVHQLQQYLTEDTQKSQQNDALIKEFKSTVEQLSKENFNHKTGQVLLERKRNLPDIRELDAEIRHNEKLLSQENFLILQHQEALEQLNKKVENTIFSDTSTVNETSNKETSKKSLNIEMQYQSLIDARKLLLKQAILVDKAFISALNDVQTANFYLRETLEQYHKLLNEKLLWMRNAEFITLKNIIAIPQQLDILFSPLFDLDFITEVISHKLYFIGIISALFLLIFSWLTKKKLIERLIKTSLSIKKASKDNYLSTVHALIITILLSLPWVILCVMVAISFIKLPHEHDSIYILGEALLQLSEYLFYFFIVYNALLDKGLCVTHFRWEATKVAASRARIFKYGWVFFPFYFLALLISKTPSVEYDSSIGILSIIILAITLSTFLKRRIVFNYMVDKSQPHQFYNFIIKLVLFLAPTALICLSLFGYLYGANTVTKLFIDSVFYLFPITILYQMLKRWIWMSQRKLALKLEIEKREAARKINQQEQLDEIAEAIEEPEIDLVSISTETNELLNIFTFIIIISGLTLIWAPLFPALSILDTVTLWQSSQLVDGVDVTLPVTLSDAFFAFIVATLSLIALKKLPSLLEITLFQKLNIDAGTRYAGITLTKYAIIVITVIWLTNALGFQWAQMQWLVAAMGVGIGFGLQEIIANFISGLIILFERPIRIGDVVSIGDTDGIVTKIEIRATTIRRWDRKELLVPNKEFITGRLLNWTLSDSVTRNIITVGVAYGSDVNKAMQIIEDICRQEENVLTDPSPTISFEEFGDDALIITARIYFNSIDKLLSLKTTINTKVYNALNDAGIGIAFPQRDVHLDTSSPLEVKFVNEEAVNNKSTTPA